MSDSVPEDRDLTPAEAAMLDQLIRRAFEGLTEASVLPDRQAIINYIAGTATSSQEEAVRESMINSTQFRKDILSLAQEFDRHALATTTTPSQSDATVVLPDFETFSKKYGVETNKPSSKVVKKSLNWQKAMRIYLPIAAAAVVTLTLITQVPRWSNRQIENLPLVNPSEQGTMDKSQFVRLTSRGMETPPPIQKVLLTPLEAAQNEFMNSIEFKDETYKWVGTPHAEAPSANARTLFLEFVDDNGKTLADVSASIPREMSSDSSNVTAWVIAFPSRRLTSLALKNDSARVVWSDTADNQAAVMFTYPGKGGYASTLCKLFSF